MTSAYLLPSGYPVADDLEIAIDGRRAKAGRTRVADFVSCAIAGPVECSVTFPEPPQRVTIRPASAGIEPRVDGRTVAFMLDKPCKISVETPGRNPLYVFANAPETDVPDRNDPAVRWFAAGTAHEAGRIELRSGETLYIEPGAVVHGSVHARGASNVRVCGHGIIDGSRYRHHETRLLLFEHCTGVPAAQCACALQHFGRKEPRGGCRGALVFVPRASCP